jgi:hypothetical protein
MVLAERESTQRAATDSQTGRTSTVALTVEIIALAVLIGGLLAIGAFTAPTAFNEILASPQVVGDIEAKKALAGSIIGGSLRIFNVVAYVCGAILVLATSYRRTSASFYLRLTASVVSLAISLVQGLVLFPTMDASQSAGDMARFDMLHHAYEMLSQGQLVLLIVYAYGMARSLQPRPTSPTAPGPFLPKREE